MKVRRALKGFSLVELVIVIAILAILTALGISVFSGIGDKAKYEAALADARMLAGQFNHYQTLLILDPAHNNELTGDAKDDYDLLGNNTLGVDKVYFTNDEYRDRAFDNVHWVPESECYLINDNIIF